MSAIPLYSHINADDPFWASALTPYLPGTNLQVSSITVNSNGSVNLDSDNGLQGASIRFEDTSDYPLFLRNVIMPDIDVAPVKGVGLTADESDDPNYAPLAVGSLTIMGANEYNDGAVGVIEARNANAIEITSRQVFTSNLYVSTLNGQPVGFSPQQNANPMFSTIRVAQSTTTDSLIARAAWISTAQISSLNASSANISFISTTTLTSQSLFTSSINGQVINFSTTTGGSALFSSLVTANISSVFGDFTFQLVSTLAFNPSLGGFNLGGVNLGMGGFLGGLLGGLGSGIFNTILGGVALTTGIIALTNSRGTNQINSNVYEMVNTTTQLQVSTLGQSTISYLRLVSSINPNVVPGGERIVSSIIQAGTTCIRSLSDPVNLANPSTATSTIQAFGYWVPLPSNAPPTPETISTVSVASISSLTVSSINGQPYTPGGGGGGGGFDFNAAIQQLSSIIQWSDGEYYDRAIVATTVSPQYVSSGFLRFQTGNTSGGYDDANLSGLLNYRIVPGNFAGGLLQTGETTIIPSYQPLISTLSFSTMITLRNNTPPVANQQAYLEIVQTGYKGNQDAPQQTQMKDYAGLVVQDLFFSSIVGSNTTINALGNINVNCATFAINSNANGTGIISATQSAPSINCNINYHNIGGVLLGYYGYGSAYVQYGFQTSINAYVACGGVGFSNGWINAFNNGAVPKSSQINTCTFDYYAGLGGLQGFSNVANGQQVLIGQSVWRPGTYLAALGVAASGSNFPFSFRYLQVLRTGNNNCYFNWNVIAESGCYWNMAVYPNSALPNSISFYNTCGSAQPFYWSFVGLNYLEGTQ